MLVVQRSTPTGAYRFDMRRCYFSIAQIGPFSSPSFDRFCRPGCSEKRTYLRTIGSRDRELLSGKPSPPRRVERHFHFRGARFAYYSDYRGFSIKELPPIIKYDDTPFSNELLLQHAEDQLLHGVHIMLRGLQPVVVRASKDSKEKFDYGIRCLWHAIATYFAELLTNSHMEIRWCSGCGKDISDKKKGAVVCKDSCRSR